MTEYMMVPKALIDEIGLNFKSGNSVPVDRAYVNGNEWRELIESAKPVSAEPVMLVETWKNGYKIHSMRDDSLANMTPGIHALYAAPHVVSAEPAPETFTAEQIQKACEDEIDSWADSDVNPVAKIAVDGVRERLIEEQES